MVLMGGVDGWCWYVVLVGGVGGWLARGVGRWR